MKKLLVLMLVLGLATAANATLITLEYRAADGVTPISSVDVSVSTTFTLALKGDYTAESDTTRLYDHAAAGGVADIIGAVLGSAAGVGGGISAYDVTYDGYDIAWGDTGHMIGDIAVFSLSVLGGQTSGTVTIDSVADDYVTVLDSASIEIVPEPITIALLGLGGLFLRRRK